MADQINAGTEAGDALEQEPETGSGGSYFLRPDELLRKFSISLTNTVADTGIQGVMAPFGYTAERMAEGTGLHEKVTGLFSKQKQEHGEQLEASAALVAAFNKANASYMVSVQIARTAFENDPNAIVALALGGRRSKVLAVWLKQAQTFYRNMLSNPAFVKKMGYFGYTEDKFKAEQALVKEVLAADAKHKKEMGESQEATKVRDKALAELEDWMSKFYRIAKIACAGQSQWLEKLGIKE